MHIVYVTGMFADREQDVLTGMPNYIYKIAKYMMAVKHKVSILTVGQENRKWTYDGITVYSIKVLYKNLLKNDFGDYFIYPLVRDIAFNKALQKINSICPIALVQYAGWYGVGILYRRQFPSVLRLSTYTKIQLYAKHTEKQLQYISRVEQMAARNFDGIIAPSRALGEPYSKDIARKVTVMPTPFCYPNPEEEDTSFWKMKLSDKKYFLFFGRISPDKGIDTIARCINQILVEYQDYYFCFAGEIAALGNRNMMRVLRKSASKERNRILYLGNIPHEKLYPVIRNAECVVLPSLMDNLPNAGLEAMWLNGIVIGTRGASFDEMFQDKVSGLLMDIDDSEGLLENISYVVHMTEDEKCKMKAAAKKEMARYEVNTAGKKLERYYSFIMEKRNML